MKSHLQRLFRYIAWADKRSLTALKDAPTAHAEGLPLFAHILSAEHVWLSRLLKREPRLPVWPTLSLDECEALLNENEKGYRDFLSGATDIEISAPVHYQNTKGQEFSTPAIDILMQVNTHGAYHRGQISRIISRNGGVAVNTDFITFARDVEPGG
ncbi:MAG: DinB family protein [Spirochaetia bacterium]|nr:DinB family protein [Spirochaetia bacterium]